MKNQRKQKKNIIDKWYNLYEETKDENILDISETLLDPKLSVKDWDGFTTTQELLFEFGT